MSLPLFDPHGDLPKGLHQADTTEFFARFGSGTIQRERVAARLRQAFELVQPLGIISRVIIWGSFITAKLDPADADILWGRYRYLTGVGCPCRWMSSSTPY